MMTIESDTSLLAAIADELRPKRNESTLINDLFEAAADWSGLGRLLIEGSSRTDFPGRARQEADLMANLRRHYAHRTGELAQFQSLFDAGERLIQQARGREPPKDGFLGFRSIVADRFAFLTEHYGFRLVKDRSSDARWSSGRVFIDIGLPRPDDTSCWIGREAQAKDIFAVEELLFMHGAPTSAITPGHAVDSPEEVERWLTRLAEVVRRYGPDILADRPGAFERLAAAAAERNRLLSEAMSRRHASTIARSAGP